MGGYMYMVGSASVNECSGVPKMFYGLTSSEFYILKDVKVN
jgi:hypothetical protein